MNLALPLPLTAAATHCPRLPTAVAAGDGAGGVDKPFPQPCAMSWCPMPAAISGAVLVIAIAASASCAMANVVTVVGGIIYILVQSSPAAISC